MLENQSNALKSTNCSKIIQMLENNSKPRKSLKYSKIIQILENQRTVRRQCTKPYGGNLPNCTATMYQTARCNRCRWAWWNPDKIPWKKSKAQNSPQVNFSRQICEKILKYQITWKFGRWEPSCSTWAEGRNMTKLRVVFCNFAKST